jgi:uncharacterized pyridoxamine 5'-phosphate oxidase family protein
MPSLRASLLEVTIPYIEYSKTTKDNVWVRVSGGIMFDDDIKRRRVRLI